MDGWMDGEVLIIGIMVGWSGGVPKCLSTVELRAPGHDLHSLFFSKAIFFDFFRCWVDFGRFWEAKTGAEIDFREVFFR